MKTAILVAVLTPLLAGQTPSGEARPAASAGAREPGLYAVIATSMGTVTARLFEKETPLTVRNFTSLVRGLKAFRDPKTGEMVRRPFYNGVKIHRVMPGFMIQIGDLFGDGTYNPGFTIKDEFLPTLKFDQPGRLAMANIGEPNTGGCQFFITEVPTPHLDGQHTIFGQVVEGQDVIKQIAHVPAAGEKPKTPVIVRSITVQREGPPPAPPAKPAAPAKKK
jgi:cyclophilin family peptidyl-prolyl cis-trans isomerase